jgi:hypothetical protein
MSASWEKVQSYKFALKDQSHESGFFDVLADFNVEEHSMEHILLAIDSLANTEGSAGLFKPKGKSKLRPGLVVFETIRKQAMKVLSECSMKESTWSQTTSFLVLRSILGLIASCKDIDRQSRLKKACLAGIDWEKGIDEVSASPNPYQIVIKGVLTAL